MKKIITFIIDHIELIIAVIITLIAVFAMIFAIVCFFRGADTTPDNNNINNMFNTLRILHML